MGNDSPRRQGRLQGSWPSLRSCPGPRNAEDLARRRRSQLPLPSGSTDDAAECLEASSTKCRCEETHARPHRIGQQNWNGRQDTMRTSEGSPLPSRGGGRALWTRWRRARGKKAFVPAAAAACLGKLVAGAIGASSGSLNLKNAGRDVPTPSSNQAFLHARPSTASSAETPLLPAWSSDATSRPGRWQRYSMILRSGH